MMEEKVKENIIFGKRVAYLRKQKGISQEQLSYSSKLNRTYMGAIERGEKTPSLTTMIKIAHGLNMNLKELLGDEF